MTIRTVGARRLPPTLVAVAVGLWLTAAPNPTSAEPSCARDGGHLLVADIEAATIFAYSLPSFRRTGELSGVTLGNHSGTLALPDGRILLTDDAAGEILAIALDEQGRIQVVDRVAADLGESGAWAAADRDFRHFVVTSSKEEGASQTANVVDLADFTNTQLELVNVTEEGHPFVTEDWLIVGTGGEVRAFSLDEVLTGAAPDAASIIPIGTGSHGPTISHDLQRGYISTTAGLEGFDYSGGTLTPLETTIPWNVGDRVGGRNGRPRLSWDGIYIYGAVQAATPTEPERWADREVDVHVSDLLNETAKRIPLGRGIVPKFQLSRTYALFSNVTGEGDYVHLFDVSRGSPSFQQVVAKIELEPLASGPIAGQPVEGAEARASAITPDGCWGFVSHGGEGFISVIDTQRKAVLRTIHTPTPLRGGGYLVAVQPGVTPTDTTAR